MEKSSPGFKWDDRTNPIDKHLQCMKNTFGIEAKPVAPQLFGNAGREHMEKYGTTLEQFAKIAEKNHNHSINNPLSQFRDKYTLQEILNSKHVFGPLTILQCCPTSDGGAAAIVCSEEFMNSRGLTSNAVEILAMEMSTDVSNFVEEASMLKSVGCEMSRNAATKAFKNANITPDDIQVVELHDCFSTNELITYEALGLCLEGEGGKMVDRGDNTYGGKYVVNPSGGLISKGNPLGATGLAQCYELCRQLRGECGVCQVEGAVVGLQHNLGLGGASVVGLYKKLVPLETQKVSLSEPLPIEHSFKSDALFTEIEKILLLEKEELLKKVNAIFCFELSGGLENSDGVWLVDVKNEGKLYRGSDSGLQPDCTIKMSDENCLKLLSGKLNPQAAFLQGKVKVSGNMGLAMKLQQLTKTLNSKL